MFTDVPSIAMRDILHFLGWRGTPVEESLLRQLQDIVQIVQAEITPCVVTRAFGMDADFNLENTVFAPEGNDIHRLLAQCSSTILMAATLGAQSERLLLRWQARSSADALLMDAVLSAAIEAVCDQQERELRKAYAAKGLYLTDRFSPGYGDMPLRQTRDICAVLQADKTVGLTVSGSGIMIPRKSVTAILGVSSAEQPRRPSPCAVCSMRDKCSLRKEK